MNDRFPVTETISQSNSRKGRDEGVGRMRRLGSWKKEVGNRFREIEVRRGRKNMGYKQV